MKIKVIEEPTICYREEVTKAIIQINNKKVQVEHYSKMDTQFDDYDSETDIIPLGVKLTKEENDRIDEIISDEDFWEGIQMTQLKCY